MSKAELAISLFEKHQQLNGPDWETDYRKNVPSPPEWDELPEKERQVWIGMAEFVICDVTL